MRPGGEDAYALSKCWFAHKERAKRGGKEGEDKGESGLASSCSWSFVREGEDLGRLEPLLG